MKKGIETWKNNWPTLSSLRMTLFQKSSKCYCGWLFMGKLFRYSFWLKRELMLLCFQSSTKFNFSISCDLKIAEML